MECLCPYENRAKFFGTHLKFYFKSDIRLRQLIVLTVKIFAIFTGYKFEDRLRRCKFLDAIAPLSASVRRTRLKIMVTVAHDCIPSFRLEAETGINEPFLRYLGSLKR
jgi:hypothetical protein